MRIITISAFSLAIGLGFVLRQYIVFDFHDSSGVVGWISANQYPKQQEYFYYFLALLGTPLVVLLYWVGWLAYSQWVAKVTEQPIQRVLRFSAIASLPMCLCWLHVYYYEKQGALWLTISVVVTLLLKLTLLLNWYYSRRFRPVDENRHTVLTEPVLSEDMGTSVPVNRIRSILRFTFLYIVLPVFIYLLIYNGNINRALDMFHEGERLAPLNEMLHGGVVFRDIYVQHGLFQNAYLAWFGSKIFEPTLMGVRSMEQVLVPLGFIAIYLLGLHVFRGGIFTAFICFLIVSGSKFFVSPRHGLGLVAFACVASYLTYHNRKGLFADGMAQGENRYSLISLLFTSGWKLTASGIFTSLAFWYSTEVGLYTLGAISVFLIIYSSQKSIEFRIRPLPLMGYVIGLSVGFLPVAIYFLSHGALDDLIWNTYIQCKYQLATWGLRFPTLTTTLAIISEEGWQAFFLSEKFRWYLPICVYAIAGVYLTYRRLSGRSVFDEVSLKLLLLFLGGIAFFRTALGRSDGGHLTFGSTFLWLIILFPFDRGISNILDSFFNGTREGGFLSRLPLLTDRSRWQRVIKPICILLIPLVMCGWYIGEVHNPITTFKGRYQNVINNPFDRSLASEELERAGRVDIPDDQVKKIQQVVEYIQANTEPNERIFDFSSQGAYYFFANRPSVTRFHMVSYASTPGMQREVVSALERDQTRLVIFKTGGWFDNVDGIPVEERHPIIAQYLDENYEPAIDINGTEILLRK
ncbi:hypothetical protein F4083_10960 [Candidatus Poribacteria bacterium]|nr:hypothetical protein [Candidatus Poribacteria bacterium]MYI94820.1 hypothetical protein [Candidatus Poribacteria bacterium]